MCIATKVGAIVGGQTSCKAPEIDAFEKSIPKDVSIVSVHSLHGPGVDPKGQPLVLIKHRASDDDFAFVENVMSCLGSKHVYLTAEQHDRITADTQAVTHAAFLSMGAAWSANNQFPWETSRYVGGIENVKQNITLRIYSNKWHVYAGLAIMNPDAKKQIKQYAESVTELFKLMLAGNREELRNRIHTARKAVFGENDSGKKLLLRDDLLDQFSLGALPEKKLRNNHLSLLAMVDCWWKLGIVPYDHMICSTPVHTIFSCNILRTNMSHSRLACGSASPNTSSATPHFSKKPLTPPSTTTPSVPTTWSSLSPRVIGALASIWATLMGTERNLRRFRSTLNPGFRRRQSWGMR
jgi:prephenate dehydrogenase (NADP+)